MPSFRRMLLVLCALLTLPVDAARAIEDPDGEAPGIPDVINDPPPLPKEFAFTFSLPYAQGDEFPREPEEFDRMLGLLKSAGYNTVHCPYTDWRVPLFKKHGMKMMVDVLCWKPPVEADIRRASQRSKVKEMCEKLRGNDAIWGYNLWNERLDWCGNFKFLDAWIRMLRTWDPTHPVWVGTYRYLYCEHFPTNPGVHGWYDYSWTRGIAWNLKNLQFYLGIARKHHGYPGKWLEMAGYNRDLYQVNTSIVYGVKTVIWFIGGPYAARQPDKSKRWNDKSYMIQVGRHFQPLYGLVGEMGLPYAVYSTPTTRDPGNRDKPAGLPNDTIAFPKDFWLQVKQGEVLCGMFKMKDDADIAYIVNHNAFAPQGLVLDIDQTRGPLVISRFDLPTGKWVKLGARRRLSISIDPADATVLRFEQDKSAKVIDDQEPVGHTPAENFAKAGDELFKQNLLADAKPTPNAVYSTPARRTADNQDKELGLPEGAMAFPDDFWLQVKQGEAVCGFFKLKEDGTTAVSIANANRRAPQGVVLAVRPTDSRMPLISEFNSDSGAWTTVGVRADLEFAIAPGESQLFKFDLAKGKPAPEPPAPRPKAAPPKPKSGVPRPKTSLK